MISDETKKEIKFAFEIGSSVEQVCLTYKIGKTLAYQIKSISEPVQKIKTNDDFDFNRVLFSCLHIPYQHPDSLDFLAAIKDEYDIGEKEHSVICLGDEVDNHAINYHEKDPMLLHPLGEREVAIYYFKTLQKIFPAMTILESNHGSLHKRKAKTTGFLPSDIKPYKELFDIKTDWKWELDLTVEIREGHYCFFKHNKGANVTQGSYKEAMSYVQGHHHSKYSLNYWGNRNDLYFAMQLPCLIDSKSRAFAYNKNDDSRPMIGAAVLESGMPKLIPMVKKKSGAWNGKIN